jgi:hypothetical protein
MRKEAFKSSYQCTPQGHQPVRGSAAGSTTRDPHSGGYDTGENAMAFNFTTTARSVALAYAALRRRMRSFLHRNHRLTEASTADGSWDGDENMSGGPRPEGEPEASRAVTDAILGRSDAPTHLFAIPELDFAGDLFGERVVKPWFRLAAWTNEPRRDSRGVEDVVSRQSFMLATESFAKVFDALESVGNVIRRLGVSTGWIIQEGDEKRYDYAPFYRFELGSSGVFAEPLVFVRDTTTGSELVINPDLWLALELEERVHGSGIWWNPRKGYEALRMSSVDEDNARIVEIRTDHLLKYLQSRQLSLVIGHYRHLHFFDPTQDAIDAFVAGDVTLGSAERGTKVILQNWGLRNDREPFLQRRLHLWSLIPPPAIDVEDPWSDEPPFDPYHFVLPTRSGPVAPARWKHFHTIEGRIFDGVGCDFMDRIYFRQELLQKYEGAAGFVVGDNGSVSCHSFWGLSRSTERWGNELLSTAIGDFAEGVPFDEWRHWQQHVVDPPSPESAAALRVDQTVPAVVNALVSALSALNRSFASASSKFGVSSVDGLWRGSVDSLAGRQLKWVYSSAADDNEFLKRATLTSTLVLDALESAPMRNLLSAIGKDLDKDITQMPPRTLGSRNLLQRVALVAIFISELRPELATLPILISNAEGKLKAGDAELQSEVESLYRRIREIFAPLAFLYDLRTHGGLAHHPNKKAAATAAVRLGLAEANWRRADYLRLLRLTTDSILKISELLQHAEHVLFTPSHDGL